MRHLRSLLIPLLACALLTGGLSLHAQGNVYSPDQINQMVAPIALYPDALMSQVLMASTYPNQVIETDQWVQANPGLAAGRLDQALATATWDPSVIALCKFPTVLDRMAQNITWTTDLGNAFLYQQVAVMDAVQALRSAAYQNGSLRTNQQERVVMQGSDIVIQPYAPEVIYVPTYQPSVVYGSYWNYPSYYYPGVWDPWPGYSFVNGFSWGLGYLFGNILFGGCDWGRHDVWMDYGVLNNCSIYRNTPYYNDAYAGGRRDRQTWAHQPNSGNYGDGMTGQPYGGRTNGRINGVTAGNAVRRTEPGAVNGPRGGAGRGSNLQAQGGRTGDMTRGANRPAQQGATRDMARGANRPAVREPLSTSEQGRNRQTVNGSANYSPRGANRSAVREPLGISEQGRNRQAAQGLANNSVRGANRPAAHGPTGYSGQGSNRQTAQGVMNNSARGASRPAVHQPSGYLGRGSSRPAVHEPSGYLGHGSSRPAVREPLGYSGQGSNRSAVTGPTNNSPRGANRPAVRPPTSNARPNYDRQAARPSTSNARPSYSQSNARSQARTSVGSAPRGNAGGAKHAPAAPRGGQKAHKQR